MKKILLTAIIAVSLVTTAFATEKNKVNSLIRNSFNMQFRDVKDVEWKANETFVTATFLSENSKKQAFYDYQGALLGTSEAIAMENLPVRAKRTFANKYADYTVTEAIKFDSGNETAYFISASKDNASVVLKVLDGQVSKFK